MAGKILAIISGILGIVGTFILSWFSMAGQFGSGLGLILNLIDPASPFNMFTNAAGIAASWDPAVPFFAIYIVGGFYIFFLLSWIFQLIGAKSRVMAIIGSLMPIAMAGAIIGGGIQALMGIPEASPPNAIFYVGMFLSDQLGGAIPFDLALGPGPVSIGTYVLLASGLLGLVSGFMKRN